ncbi:M15 family metallopeptidase domain-containing protein [Pedobacter agri]|uniref:Peptidase M15C domain-containing protein n=1 Tax=Pedobacter agri TaxID=454586 RepID=A0A9X3DF00_9SPHI|nr:hypothetical protein [Pedobacter agri]MCX3264930.1 hypothetical protein [Pedobacter agri]
MASLNKLQFTFTRNLNKLLTVCFSSGFEVTMGEVFRTELQQQVYFKLCKTKTLDSYHLKRLAVDLHLFKDNIFLSENSAYEFLAEYWGKLDPRNFAGYYWGWDAMHFEMREYERSDRR